MPFAGWRPRGRTRRGRLLQGQEASLLEGVAPAGVSRVPIPTDRGSRRGAKRCYVTRDQLAIIDADTFKSAGLNPKDAIFFQSRSEAKWFIFLEGRRRNGQIRPLPGQEKWRQVDFPLITITPAGLKATVAKLRLDFAYLERNPNVGLEAVDAWRPRYEDVKPRGGLREDTYLLKKRWFEAQYGVQITEL